MNRASSAAVVPVYNPEPGLRVLVERLLEHFSPVVVVDDGSVENCADFDMLPSEIVLLRHPENRGKGAAIKTALAYLESDSLTDTVVFLDGDGQHRIEDALRVSEICLRENAVVFGVRNLSRGKVPFRSWFGNFCTSLLVFALFRFRLGDTQTGLRALPRRLFKSVLLLDGNGYEFESHIFGFLRRRRERLIQVPIETIYLNSNRSSHFSPFRDSVRIHVGLYRDFLLNLIYYNRD